MKFKYLGFPFVIATTLPVFAQDFLNEITPFTLDETVVTADRISTKGAVGTKIDTPILETPQSVSSITRGEMDLRGVQSLNDAVTYTAGVQAAPQGIDSRVDDFNIRGYEAGGFTNNIYLDGLRGPSGSQWNRTQFDSFGLERVEVVKGPSATLYGQVSPGGVVNAVSKLPQLENFTEVGFQVGSYDTYQGTFDFNRSNADETLLFRLVGLVRDGGSQVDETDLSRFFIAPSLTWNISDQTSLTLLSQFQVDNGGSTYQFLPQTGTLFPAVPDPSIPTVGDPGSGYLDNSAFLGDPSWNSYDRKQFTLGYQFEHELRDGLKFRQNARYTYLESDYRAMVGVRPDASQNTDTTDGLTDGHFYYPRRAVRGPGESNAWAIDTMLEGTFETGSIEHTLVGGLDFTRSDWDGHRLVNSDVAPIDIFNPSYDSNLGTTLNNSTSWTNSFQDVTEIQTGLYLQEQAKWGKLHATLGVRQDWYDIDSVTISSGVIADSDVNGNGGTNSESRIKQTPTSTTWRGGLLYKFDNNIAPYASYASSFNSAPYTQLDTDGNPLNKPTEAFQYEIGVKYQPNEDAIFTASLFQLTEENRATVVLPGQYAQFGEARTRGAELEARVELFHGFDLIGTYTYLDTEITESSVVENTEGNRLPSVPEHMASLWLSYTFDQGLLDGLTIGGGARYNGSVYGDDQNTIRVPDYTLYDASLTYDLSKAYDTLDGATLRISATNLTDERYVANSTFEGAAWYGAARNVTCGISYRW